VGGYIPYIAQLTTSRTTPPEYEAVAINVQIPIFNGGLFKARREEAHYRAMEADQRLRNEAEAVARDVRSAWANATMAYQRMDVTAEMVRQATLARELAQQRYNLGLSSIVELTDALLNLTTAEVEDVNAKYDYPLLSGYKVNRLNWLESSNVSSWESDGWSACKMGVFSKSVTLRICRIW
jgi:outer membrane protein TolC